MAQTRPRRFVTGVPSSPIWAENTNDYPLDAHLADRRAEVTVS